MALTKETTVDQVEVVGDFNAVQVRTRTTVKEDGVVISSSLQRKVIHAGDDYSAEDAKVQAICAVVHTADVVAAYQASIAQE